MERKYIVAFAFVALLFAAGCTASSKSCCSKADALDAGNSVCKGKDGAVLAPLPYGNAKMPSMRTELRCCAYPDGTQTGLQPDLCPIDENAGYCKVAYYRCLEQVEAGSQCWVGGQRAYPNGQFIAAGDPDVFEDIPICIDDVPNKCVQEDCNVQLCGKDAITTMPPMSAQDAASALETEIGSAATASALRSDLLGDGVTFEDEEWAKVATLESGADVIVKRNGTSSKEYRVEREGESLFKAHRINDKVDPNKVDLQAISVQSSAINLYGATCSVEPMTKKTLNRVKKAGGELWANTFRFGIGSNFSDYEESRLYFPMSDQFCGVPTGGTKDRYMNYKIPYEDGETPLNTPCPQVPAGEHKYGCGEAGEPYYASLEICNKNCGLEQCIEFNAGNEFVCVRTNVVYSSQGTCGTNCHGAPSTDVLACAQNRDENAYPYSQNPFLSSMGNYAISPRTYHEATDCAWEQDGHNDIRDCYHGHDEWWGPVGDEDNDGFHNVAERERSYSEINKGYYTEYFENLPYFEEQTDEGYIDASDQHQDGAEYECQSGSECMSGVCSKDSGSKRSACVDKDTGDEIDCGCYRGDYGMVVCDAVRNAPNDGNAYGFTRYVYEWDSPNDYDYNYYKTSTTPIYRSGVDDRPFEWANSYWNEDGYYALIGHGQNWEDAKLLDACEVDLTIVEQSDGHLSTVGGVTLDWAAGEDVYEENGVRGNVKPSGAEYGQFGSWFYAYDAVMRIVPVDGSIGRCEISQNNDGIQLAEHGVCEPCTTSTIAVQPVTSTINWNGLQRGYCPIYSATLIEPDYANIQPPQDAPEILSSVRFGEDYAHLYRKDTCEAGGNSGVMCDWRFNERVLQCKPNQQGEYWPMLKPDETYLHDKLNTYLSSNVLPVLDIRDNMGGNGISNPQSNDASKLAYSYLQEITYNGQDYIIIEEMLDYKTLITSFLKDRGAVVLVIANVEDFTDGSSGFWAADGIEGYTCGDNCQAKNIGGMLKETDDWWRLGYTGDMQAKILTKKEYYFLKAKVLKEECPKCLIAVAAKDRSAYEGYLADIDVESTYELDNPLDNLFLPTRFTLGGEWESNEPRSDYIDLIVNSWYIPINMMPPFLPDDLPSYAAGEVDEQANFSGKMIRKYHRPLLTWNFTIGTQLGMGFDVMVEEVFNRQRDLSSSGVMGIVYGNWKGTHGGNNPLVVSSTPLALNWVTGQEDRGGAFCAMQQASREIVGVEDVTYYQKLYAQEICECTPCTDEEKSAGLCGGDNLNTNTPGVQEGMGKCTVGGLDPTGDAAYDYRAPPSCITDSCVQCSDTVGSAVCSRISDGEKTFMGSVEISGLNDATRDIIAALPTANKCCIVDEAQGGKYTYIAHTGTMASNEQILYHKTGMLAFDCGKTPDLSPSVCGVNIDVENAKVTCTVQP